MAVAAHSPISAYFTLSSVFPTILLAHGVTEKKRESGFLACFPSPVIPRKFGAVLTKKSGELIKSPSRLLAGVSLHWPCFLQR
jgi:energy-converting hydrogenase Eha subunit A